MGVVASDRLAAGQFGLDTGQLGTCGSSSIGQGAEVSLPRPVHHREQAGETRQRHRLKDRRPLDAEGLGQGDDASSIGPTADHQVVITGDGLLEILVVGNQGQGSRHLAVDGRDGLQRLGQGDGTTGSGQQLDRFVVVGRRLW
jgi:hypothetical protein